jgi:hypothetical protein
VDGWEAPGGTWATRKDLDAYLLWFKPGALQDFDPLATHHFKDGDLIVQILARRSEDGFEEEMIAYVLDT